MLGGASAAAGNSGRGWRPPRDGRPPARAPVRRAAPSPPRPSAAPSSRSTPGPMAAQLLLVIERDVTRRPPSPALSRCRGGRGRWHLPRHGEVVCGPRRPAGGPHRCGRSGAAPVVLPGGGHGRRPAGGSVAGAVAGPGGKGPRVPSGGGGRCRHPHCRRHHPRADGTVGDGAVFRAPSRGASRRGPRRRPGPGAGGAVARTAAVQPPPPVLVTTRPPDAASPFPGLWCGGGAWGGPAPPLPAVDHEGAGSCAHLRRVLPAWRQLRGWRQRQRRQPPRRVWLTRASRRGGCLAGGGRGGCGGWVHPHSPIKKKTSISGFSNLDIQV